MRNRMLIVAAFVAAALTASEPTIAPVAAPITVTPVSPALRESIPTVEPELDLTEPATPAEMAAAVEGWGYSKPDTVNPWVIGGGAARLYNRDGVAVPGDVFKLTGLAGAKRHARVWDNTQYTYKGERYCPDTITANINANFVANTLTGADVPVLDLTGAAGCGPSGGVAYTLGYLNIVTDGAFTGDLTVAATGTISRGGHHREVQVIEQKLPAAWAAGADVMFTTKLPAPKHSSRNLAIRIAGLDDNRVIVTDPGERVELYRELGATRPEAGLDVITVAHIVDVAAYLCGAGNDAACEIVDVIDTDMIEQLGDLPVTESFVVDELAVA